MAADHFNIALVDAPLVKGDCFICDTDAAPDDTYMIAVQLPDKTPLYFHDDQCFDQFLNGLIQFESVRDRLRLNGTNGERRIN